MNTIVNNWQIVSIIENGEIIGEVLWANVVEDMTCRFSRGDYVCSSQIVEVHIHREMLKTASGSIYQILGKGKRAQIEFKDFELLRHGFSPQQIASLNKSLSRLQH